jgi:hypothetical protein
VVGVGSGGGFEGDFVAEGFELVDVVAFLAVRPAATRAARADPPRVVLVRAITAVAVNSSAEPYSYLGQNAARSLKWRASVRVDAMPRSVEISERDRAKH